MSDTPTDSNVLDLLGSIRAGQIAGRSLSPETRRLCVDYLAAEGAANAEMAQLLDVTDRTIRRDREAIRETNALKIDDGFADRIAGELIEEGRRAVDRIRRIARDKQIAPAVRIEGERASFEILDRVAQRLQSLGYLPMATRQIKADLTHSLEPLESPEEIVAELKRLEGFADGTERGLIGSLQEQARVAEPGDEEVSP
ncbi:MAG: hypothetical protein AAFR96_07020 [Planctomycetota bacterium]